MALFISVRKHEWERPCGGWFKSQSPADHDVKTARILYCGPVLRHAA